MARSTILRSLIIQRLCPVANGALTVEHVLDQSQIRSLYAVGILFELETFDPNLHPDAVDERGRQNELVFKDEWYSKPRRREYVVHDRITWLLKQVSALRSIYTFKSS